MNKLTVGALMFSVAISGCASTINDKEYSKIPVTANEMKTVKWEQLNRFPARYPEKAVINSIEGCATIEYVITPNNEIKDLTVIFSTNKHFAKAAKSVIENWQWAELPNGIISEPVKTQTRFDFCFDKPNQSCANSKPEYSCPSEDIIYSTGTRVKVSR